MNDVTKVGNVEDKLATLRPLLVSIAKDKVDSLEYAAAMIELRRLTKEWFE